MSQGANQWITLPSSGIFISLEGEIRRYVLVGYSNPDSSGLPNAVIYGVRLIADKPHVDAVPTHQCCFAPKSIVPLSRGLHWINGVLEYDPMEDWRRFSHPLQQFLTHTRAMEHSHSIAPPILGCTGGDQQTLEGVPYKDSLVAQMRWWSQSEGKFQDAIWN
jgi:hypothetical protein